MLVVILESAPHSTAPQDLVQRLRDDVVPAAVGGSDVVVSVSGVTALFADMADLFSRRLPVFIGAVLVVSFLLLMAVFRSLLVPLKAAVMNLLSIGAAYGVVVAVYQWGWGASLIGVDRPAPIMAFVPMMLFAILFGLSMDYEVFLLSRIREEYDRSGDNATAVADGLAGTARVITAAAAIMVIIFGSFVLGDDPFVKMFGLGLAVAVFVDATIVRMVLVPATMELRGDVNWWLPRWLERWLPALDLEGGAVAADPTGPAADAPRPAHVRGGVVAWLESLTDDERGRAAGHVERALADGAVTAADRHGSSEVVLPLGRRTRRLLLTPSPEGYTLDVRSGRSAEVDWHWSELQDQLLRSEPARASYEQVRGTAQVADLLRSLREARELSASDVAERAGTTVDVVDRLERADGSVGVTDLIGVGQVLDARIDLAGSGVDRVEAGGAAGPPPGPPVPGSVLTRRRARRPPRPGARA
ncbi:MMPL family transporter [Actinomarinicola tropica]|uniref:MMPL family transporter n=1 Tax=Actinomarinicola tropica TaxID=2789776 RepID=UPI00226C2D6F|nr:MMPL family transporter [Actinomarinicola tropica]